MLVSIGAYNICDGTLSGGVAISGLSLGVARGFEVVRTLAALNPQTYDRVNRVTTASFHVYRTHASADAAEAFIMGLDASLPSTGTVTFTRPTGSVSMPNGVVTSHQSSQQGSTTTTQYTITGGQLS
jgi:hypothetical protein